MKNQRKKVEIPAAVAEAISGMLFKEKGVDMTPVIDALSANRSRTRGAVAITTALLMKGFYLTPTTQTRYKVEKSSYSDDPEILVKKYTYKDYAPYDDRVYYVYKVMFSEPQKGKETKNLANCYQVGYESSICYMDEDSWESLLEFDELPEEIQEILTLKVKK